MTDEPLTSCSTCDAPVQRVFHPVAVHFKGSGFYSTDYGEKKAAAASDSTSKPESKDSTGSKESKGSKDGGGGSKSGSSGSSD
jgi:predicted nucleic acid-binding Zn ribbon protein